MLNQIKQTATLFDTKADDFFDRYRGNKKVDRLFYVASEAADYSKAWHILGALLALKNPALRKHWLRMALALGFESALVNGGIKKLTNRERPELSEKVTLHARRPKTSSLPSGHASSAALASTLLTAAAPKAKFVWFVAAKTVAISRVHNRMHHGTDVAAGWVVGKLLAAATKKIWKL